MTIGNPERLRVRPSVLDAHRANRADPGDIQRAYLRFAWARRKTAPRLSVLRWLLAGVAIGFGVASAATLVPPPQVRSVTPNAGPDLQAAIVKHPPVARRRRTSVDREEPAATTPSAAPVTSAPGAPAPPFASLPSRAAAGSLGVAGRPPLPSVLEPSSASDWQRAAAALRGGDIQSADAALARLEQSESLRDRQAAELARAQLLMSRGRIAEATPKLQRLAREADSSVVRAQATSMLQDSTRQ